MTRAANTGERGVISAMRTADVEQPFARRHESGALVEQLERLASGTTSVDEIKRSSVDCAGRALRRRLDLWH